MLLTFFLIKGSFFFFFGQEIMGEREETKRPGWIYTLFSLPGPRNYCSVPLRRVDLETKEISPIKEFVRTEGKAMLI